MDRRQFLTWVGVGALANSLPMVLAACTSTPTEEPQATPERPEIDPSVRPDGYSAIGTTEQLNKKGTILDQNRAEQPILVLRNSDSNTLSALNPTCTHRGCIVELKADEKILTCPCHGSKFALDGKVVEGPANRPLTTFEVKEENNLVLVKVT